MGGTTIEPRHLDWGRIQRGIASLKPLPPPDSLESTLPEGSIALITDDGTDLTVSLASSLATRGWNVVVLSYPAISQRKGKKLKAGETSIPLVIMDEMSEEYLQKKLDEIASTYGPVGAVIHLNPRISDTTDEPDSQGKLIVKHMFMLAKHLKEPLNRAAEMGRSIFMSVIRLDGEFGLGEQTDFDPISGGLFGLVKTLNLEWEPVFCRAIDLDPVFDAQESTRYILAELFDPNRLISEVGYSSKGRLTLIVEPA